MRHIWKMWKLVRYAYMAQVGLVLSYSNVEDYIRKSLNNENKIEFPRAKLLFMYSRYKWWTTGWFPWTWNNAEEKNSVSILKEWTDGLNEEQLLLDSCIKNGFIDTNANNMVWVTPKGLEFTGYTQLAKRLIQDTGIVFSTVGYIITFLVGLLSMPLIHKIGVLIGLIKV